MGCQRPSTPSNDRTLVKCVIYLATLGEGTRPCPPLNPPLSARRKPHQSLISRNFTAGTDISIDSYFVEKGKLYAKSFRFVFFLSFFFFLSFILSFFLFSFFLSFFLLLLSSFLLFLFFILYLFIYLYIYLFIYLLFFKCSFTHTQHYLWS